MLVLQIVLFHAAVFAVKTSGDDGGEDVFAIGSEVAKLRHFLITRRRAAGIGPHDKPTLRDADWVAVNLEFYAMQFVELDELGESLTIVPDFMLEWRDIFWRWDNVANFSHIKRLEHVPDDVWTPSILHLNNANDMYLLSRQQAILEKGIPVLYLFKDGNTHWFPPSSTMTTMCDLDFDNFPFEKEQVCSFRMTLLEACEDVHLVNVSLFTGPPTKDYAFVSENLVWDLVSANVVKHADCGFTTAVEFRFVFRRKPLFFVYSQLLPFGFIGLTQLATFFLPANEPERSSFSMTALLAVMVVQSNIQNQIPKSSKMNKISILVAVQLTSSTMITIYAAVSCYVSQILSLGKDDRNHAAENKQLTTAVVISTDRHEKLLKKIDLFLFFVFLFVFALSVLSLLLLMVR